ELMASLDVSRCALFCNVLWGGCGICRRCAQMYVPVSDGFRLCDRHDRRSRRSGRAGCATGDAAAGRSRRAAAAERRPGIAPPGVVDGEIALADGDNAIQLTGGRISVYRVDVEPDQHAAVSLWFADTAGVTLTAERWDGHTALTLAATNAGAGKRFLTVL